MISLSIADFEEFDVEKENGVAEWTLDRYEDIDAYEYPVFCESRVGYAVVKYYDTYHKFPHRYVPERASTGYEIENICPDCFRDAMFDSHSNCYYCPMCELK